MRRRRFLKAATTTAAAALMGGGPGRAAAEPQVSEDMFAQMEAKLYDATKCIGCRACARACREANKLPGSPEELHGVRFDMPRDLSPNNWMVIQAYAAEAEAAGAPKWSFIKRNCMHCNVPACVSVCPVAAMHKAETGAVEYDESRCIGCRYCMMACPYGVPRYEWVRSKPAVRKCTFVRACIKACPTGALMGGLRGELLDEAHRRIRDHPGRYVNHVYGEHEAGGTSYLILSSIPVERFGLPKLDHRVRSHYADSVVDSLPGWIIGMGLFLGGLHRLESRQRARRATRPAPEGKEPT